jgi:hypothetical protein
MDHTVRPRFIVECTSSRVEDGAVIWNGRVLDLSIPGWSRLGLKGIMTGDYLQLHLHLPGQRDPLSVPLATVRWIYQSRFAVAPILMDADDQLRLSRFVIEQSDGGSLSDGCHDHIVIAECS